MAWTEWLVPAASVPQVRGLSTLGAFVLLAIAVEVDTLSSGHAIGGRVYGAIVLHLLLGPIWAVTYRLLDPVSSGSFAGRAEGSTGLADWAHSRIFTLTPVE